MTKKEGIKEQGEQWSVLTSLYKYRIQQRNQTMTELKLLNVWSTYRWKATIGHSVFKTLREQNFLQR